MPRTNTHQIRFLIFILLMACFLALSPFIHFDQQTVQDYLKGFPLFWSGLIFIFLYVGLTFFIWVGPKDVLRVVGAFLFGPYLSTVIVWVGEMGNLCVMFSLSRHFGRGYVAERMPGKMQRLDRVIAEKSFWGIFFLKFFPVIPFRFLDLAFGLTRISLKKYLLISAVASQLRIFVIQFFIALGMDTVLHPAKLSAYLEAHPSVFFPVFLYL
ncbi:MAG: VTT domain-containing protein, partial [Candidatus Omnitrophota bacterium]